MIGWKEVLATNIELGKYKPKNELLLHYVAEPSIKEEFKKIVDNYEPVNTEGAEVKMRIVLKDEAPVYQHPRRLANNEQVTVNTIIDKWLKDGIIRPSASEYASPIVLVKKKMATRDSVLIIDG